MLHNCMLKISGKKYPSKEIQIGMKFFVGAHAYILVGHAEFEFFVSIISVHTIFFEEKCMQLIFIA